MKDRELLEEVLKQYGMVNFSSELIRHNENMTYCIGMKIPVDAGLLLIKSNLTLLYRYC